jgi:hypothetical protein
VDALSLSVWLSPARSVTFAKLSQVLNARCGARDAAARKAAVSFAFYSSLSLLIGAFIASVAGALGGYHRDEILGRVLINRDC